MSFERILAVDDDQHIAGYIKTCLEKEGYVVHIANDGNSALVLFQQFQFHLVLLDIMMPGMDGFELLSEIRKSSNVPVIFLSARGDEPDKIIGLGLGADDYVTKPFSPGELGARVKAHLRRLKAPTGGRPSIMDFGHLVVDINARQVLLEDSTVELTRREFDILAYLAANPGRVFTFEQIYSSVWQEEYLENSNVVMVHIKRLREKLKDDPKQPRFIKTVWGVGYKFIA